ncbi:MAG: hypothetical protein ACK5MN_08915 [Lachnospiraceae bacterium]
MNKFKEWISDNLRYIILVVVVIAVLSVITVGVYFAVNNNRTADSGTTTPAAESTTEATATPEATEAVTDNALKTSAYPAVNSLISSYFTALGAKDIDTLRTLVDTLSDEDVQSITQATYITSYTDVIAYTKNGLTEGSYIVYASYKYHITDIATPVPSISQLYVITSGEQLVVMTQAESDAQISELMTTTAQDADVTELIQGVEAEYRNAQESDATLRQFLDQMEANNES